jgi:hypothetical protein
MTRESASQPGNLAELLVACRAVPRGDLFTVHAEREVQFVDGPRCAHPVAATRPISDRPRGPTSATPGRHTNGAGARPTAWRTGSVTLLTPPGRPRRKRSQGFPREPVVPALGAGAKPHPGTVHKPPVDLLAGHAALLDQLPRCIFHFDVQDLLQFMGEVALGSAVDEGLQGREQIAPAREPHRLKGLKALGIKLGISARVQ